VTGVVVIVATIPCHSMGDMASVTSGVRPSYVGSLAVRWGLERGGVCVQAQEGSGEAELASEAQGVGRGGTCVRGSGVRLVGACARP